MKNLLIGLLALGSISAFANVGQIKCQLEGKAFINGKELTFLDDSILGKIDGTNVIFDESDDNYQHVRTIKLQANKTLTYAIEGVDFRNDRVTIIVYTQRNTSPASETISMFKIPLKQKRFSGHSEIYLDGSKESHKFKLSCEMN